MDSDPTPGAYWRNSAIRWTSARRCPSTFPPMAVPTIRHTPATRTGSAKSASCSASRAAVAMWVGFGPAALRCHKAVTSPGMRRIKVGSVCARLRAVERIRLSPEDYSEPEMRRLTHTLLRDGVRVFVFSFHSPSVMPGGTPYVRSQGDLDRFLRQMPALFRFLHEAAQRRHHDADRNPGCARERRRPDPYSHTSVSHAVCSWRQMFYQLKDRVRRYRFAGSVQGCPASGTGGAGRVVQSGGAEPGAAQGRAAVPAGSEIIRTAGEASRGMRAERREPVRERLRCCYGSIFPA